MLISWMSKKLTYRICLVTICLAIATIIGCGGGGGGGDDKVDPKPSIQVIPIDHDFGIVTSGNMAAPLEIKIQNNGSLTLNVSDIALAPDIINFKLDFDGGGNPCLTASPIIPAGGVCTVEVDFQPGSEATFTTNLSISSNDPNNALVIMGLSGTSAPITDIEVKINQVDPDSCPNPTDVTAYVSVTDQGGYPVVGLPKANFSVVEDGSPPINIDDFGTVSDVPIPLSVAVAMDYSTSITNNPDVVDDMEENVAEFIDQLGAGDEAEIIKFAGLGPEVVQIFTPDKDILKDAIFARFDKGPGTPVYDAVIKAVEDTAPRLKVRKVVIVVTDGEDTASSASLDDVISDAKAKGIAIFTVGIGNFKSDFLQQMADDTGGLFYEAANSDNTKTVFRQLADLLYKEQYVLTYATSLAGGVPAELNIEADLNPAVNPAVKDDDTKAITLCP